jgi:hypothetical protein
MRGGNVADPFDALPPWDAAPWFHDPVETFFLTPANGVRLCTYDPMRVVLMFSSNQSSAIISTARNANGAQGVVITTTNSPIILRFAEVGPLVMKEWYISAGGLASITVWTVSLRDWPRPARGRRGNGGGSRNPHESGIRPGWPSVNGPDRP